MNKILYSLIIFCLLFTACKKDRKIIQGDGAMHKVTFNVGFSQTMGDFNTNALSNKLKINSTDTAVTNYVKTIQIVVSNTDGSFVHFREQKNTDENFGTYSDNLKAGTYIVVIIAGEGDMTTKNYDPNIASMVTKSATALRTGNLFYKKFQITVANSDLTQSVTLKRLLSKVVLKTNDLIPTGANSVVLNLRDAGDSFNFGTEKGVGNSSITFNLRNSNDPLQTGVPVEIYSYYIYNVPVTVEIVVLHAQETIYDPLIKYANKTISNVPGAINTITTLTGNLFGGAGTGTTGFKVAIDSTWNVPINQGF